MTYGTKAVIPTGDYLYPPRFETAPGGDMVKLTGITHRDWLAGLAMQGIWANPEHIDFLTQKLDGDTALVNQKIAEMSYCQADAMIAEGRKNAKG